MHSSTTCSGVASLPQSQIPVSVSRLAKRAALYGLCPPMSPRASSITHNGDQHSLVIQSDQPHRQFKSALLYVDDLINSSQSLSTCVLHVCHEVVLLIQHHAQVPEWHKMSVPKNAQDQDLRIKIACRMDKPLNMKHCGAHEGGGGHLEPTRWPKQQQPHVEYTSRSISECAPHMLGEIPLFGGREEGGGASADMASGEARTLAQLNGVSAAARFLGIEVQSYRVSRGPYRVNMGRLGGSALGILRPRYPAPLGVLQSSGSSSPQIGENPSGGGHPPIRHLRRHPTGDCTPPTPN
uniref:CAPS C2 domain-containing protein n=1 Tax=Timema genevievae TaxID=629358 RepID=A0A7R9JQW1_TIMGE|nr:unnamed protein product [Timema genevievae]